MQRLFLSATLMLFPLFLVNAQEYRWKAGFEYFFDNTEYSGSSFVGSQTMNGIWFNPIGSVKWDSVHALYGGVNLLKIPGMKKAIDKVDVTLYYQYQTPKILFRAGVFPRKDVLSNYNTFFFKDSVNHFLPLIEGVFFRIGSGDNFFDAWMDWTGYATPTTRENFFIGFSGKAAHELFFADFQSYMFHYANTRPSTPDWGVSENMQLQASVGLQYDNPGKVEGMVSAGILVGYERNRHVEGTLFKPVGFTARLNAEYHGIGTQNTFYVGDPRMRLFETFGGDLYWGTPFLRGKSYAESEWYIRFPKTRRTKAQLNLNLHFSEGNLFFQQMLNVSVDIGNDVP